jgi:hypothetical protein
VMRFLTKSESEARAARLAYSTSCTERDHACKRANSDSIASLAEPLSLSPSRSRSTSLRMPLDAREEELEQKGRNSSTTA